MPSQEECKKIISRVAWKVGISPKLIATQLLSADDKVDMMSGDLKEADLEAAASVWVSNGMPDYVN